MKKWLPLLLLVFLGGCRDKKADFSGETPLTVSDLITVFPKLTPPYTVTDTNISRVADTLTIGVKAFLQFFPDSSLTRIVGSNRNVLIHPAGIIEKEKEKYLLVNFTAKKITHQAVFVIDKKNKYLASKELISSNKNDEYKHTVSVNREPTFLISKEKMGKDNLVMFSKTGWVYSSSNGVFMVVVNDSNEDPKKTAVINPIDTLARKNKLSGDYVQDKKNYISLRDTKKPNVYQFFVHFEKEEGTCIGELKGELKMKDANTAQFSENGDPCVIDFKFDGNQLTLKERGSCGTHRGIKCFFDDTFIKRKEARAKKK
jgi:hypothetical protein